MSQLIIIFSIFWIRFLFYFVLFIYLSYIFILYIYLFIYYFPPSAVRIRRPFPHFTDTPQNGPQVILNRKSSPKSTANDPVKNGGMEWISWDCLQKRTDYKRGTFFSRLLKKKGTGGRHISGQFIQGGKNLKRIWYQPYTSSFVNCFKFLSRMFRPWKI